jgi:hypothetical protein
MFSSNGSNACHGEYYSSNRVFDKVHHDGVGAACADKKIYDFELCVCVPEESKLSFQHCVRRRKYSCKTRLLQQGKRQSHMDGTTFDSLVYEPHLGSTMKNKKGFQLVLYSSQHQKVVR